MAPPYEKSVFINCPFDDWFAPLFHAIVLAVVAAGFTPRSARETEGEADLRMVRIARGLMASKYSIHDLSRFEGEGPQNLARFNMPLELGIAVGLRYLKDGSQTPHNWLALVPPNFVHQRFVSDLAGYDASDHDGMAATVIRRVAAWLSIQPDFTPPTPSAKAVLGAYPAFCAALDQAQQDALGTLTWPAIVRHAQEAAVAIMPA